MKERSYRIDVLRLSRILIIYPLQFRSVQLFTRHVSKAALNFSKKTVSYFSFMFVMVICFQ